MGEDFRITFGDAESLGSHLVWDGRGFAVSWTDHPSPPSISNVYFTRIGCNVQEVAIDVKPGSEPDSPINLGSSGTLPVAILGSADFDAAQVKPETILVSGSHVRMRHNGTLLAGFDDVNHDGYADLVIHVPTADLDLIGPDLEVVLTASMFDGTAVRGADSVTIVP